MEKLNILRDSTGPAMMKNFGHLEGLLNEIFIIAKNKAPTVICSQVCVIGRDAHPANNIVPANTVNPNIVARVLETLPC
jgi:hypothetical protein